MPDVGGDTSEGQQGDSCVQLDRTDADQDETQSEGQTTPLRDRGPSGEDPGNTQGLKEDARMPESTGDAISAWSSLELDMNSGSAGKG